MKLNVNLWAGLIVCAALTEMAFLSAHDPVAGQPGETYGYGLGVAMGITSFGIFALGYFAGRKE